MTKPNYRKGNWKWERIEGDTPSTWQCERCKKECPVTEDYFEGRKFVAGVLDGYADICLKCAKELGLEW